MKQDNQLAAQNKNLLRRLEENEAIALISQALNETLALNPVLQLIAEYARRLIPQAERTIIHLYDAEAQTLQAITVTETGELDFSAGLQMRLGEGIAGRVLANGRLINVEDTDVDERYVTFPGKPAFHRSLLVGPIKNRQITIGTISVHCRVPHAFTNDDERVLALLGTQAALAINNARLFEEVQHERQQVQRTATHLARANTLITTLGRVAASLQNTLNPKQIMSILGAELKRLGLVCLVTLLDNAGEALVVRYNSFDPDILRLPDELLGLTAVDVHLRQKDWLPFHRLVNEKQAVYDPDFILTVRGFLPKSPATDLAQAVKLENLPIHTRSLSLPLLMADKVDGALIVLGEALQESDLPTFFIFASQVATALENARLFAAEKQARRVAETLSAANQALTQSLNLDSILNTLLQHLAQLIPFDRANVMLLDSKSRLIIRAWRGYFTSDKQAVQNFVAHATEHGLLKKLLLQQASQFIPDTTKNKDWWHKDGETIIGGWMGIPLIAGGKLIGVYSLDKYETGFFTNQHLHLAETFAAQAAVAIQNGLLYEAEREQYGRLQSSQAQLIQAEKMGALGRLVSSIAHEINNPIQSIQGCVTLLGEEFNGRREQDTIELYLGIVRSELTRIANIVHNMRDFYRLAPERLQATNVHAVLDKVLKLTGKQLRQNHIAVQQTYAKDIPTIKANPNHLQQVFLNIILNAIDAMSQSERGNLHIEVMVDSSRPFRSQPSVSVIRIDFKDTGEGIDTDVLDNLFEPFFTTKDNGSGLGLSISYGIIEAHNGEILVSSEAGIGTTFTILLPIDKD